MPKYPQGSYQPSKKKKTTSLGSRPGTVTSESNHTKDKPMQAALKPYQKFGLPNEWRGAPKPEKKPQATKTVKSKPKPAKKSEPAKPSRVKDSGIKGVANTGGALTRALPSDAIRKVAPSKGVDASKKVYSEKDKKIAAIMAKGKKKNGTMKASAQRKIAKARKK